MTQSENMWLYAKQEELVAYYIEEYKEFLESLPKNIQRRECLSGLNRVKRIEYWSSKDLNMIVKPGDICFFEYGHAFLNEAGYQHFGLIISKYNQKAFVIPMTSNRASIRKAVSATPKSHLYYIGQLCGLDKRSVLFLNDSKFINTCRIISINAHLDVDSKMFKDIKTLLQEIIFP